MSTDKPRTGARILAASAGAAVSLALLAAPACLPDLLSAAPDAAPIGAPDVTPVLPPSCGDGVIDSIDNGGATNEECDPGDAGSIGCTPDCRIACDGGAIDARMGHCYFGAGATTGYGDALDRCRASSAHVVTIGSQREADVIGDAGIVDGGFWLGLLFSAAPNAYVTPKRDEPGFPNAGRTCAGCFAVGVDDAGRFADDDAGDECVIGGGARWSGHACNTPVALSVICEREPVGARIYFCGGPNCTDLPATFETKRYVLPTNLVTADEAAAACAPFGPVLMIDSPEEREQLVRELVTRFPTPLTFWIGLSSVGGQAVWADGDAGRPLPWASGEPAKNGPAFVGVAAPDSMVFDTQLAHVDGDRSAKRLVVCQRK